VQCAFRSRGKSFLTPRVNRPLWTVGPVCQQVTPIRGDVIRLIRATFDHSHETRTDVCRELRKQHRQKVSRLRRLEPWERHLLLAAEGLLMSQPGKKMNCVLPNCRLAMDELDARFSTKYQTALIERYNPDWRCNFSWICQEVAWQTKHVSVVPPYVPLSS
jgi:hypothetical protein